MRQITAALVSLLAAAWMTAAMAADAPRDEAVLTCRIQGQDREVSVSITGTRATYRYGSSLQKPELMLSSPWRTWTIAERTARATRSTRS
ncbi:hypothetical protein ACFSLT_03330 [Novosphingobium resinovorum]